MGRDRVKISEKEIYSHLKEVLDGEGGRWIPGDERRGQFADEKSNPSILRAHYREEPRGVVELRRHARCGRLQVVGEVYRRRQCQCLDLRHLFLKRSSHSSPPQVLSFEMSR